MVVVPIDMETTKAIMLDERRKLVLSLNGRSGITKACIWSTVILCCTVKRAGTMAPMVQEATIGGRPIPTRSTTDWRKNELSWLVKALKERIRLRCVRLQHQSPTSLLLLQEEIH